MPKTLLRGPGAKRFLLAAGLGWWLGLAAPLYAAGNEAFAGDAAKWVRYESPHFELFSAVSSGDSRDLLPNLELVRALFLDTFKLKERQPLPVTVYAFSREKDFFAYMPESLRKNENLGGYYLGGADRAVIVLSPAWDDDEARTMIFHEYIHHLVHTSGEAPPVWYNEGLAVLFSSIGVTADDMELGKPLEWNIDLLRRSRLLPLETLFSVDYNSPVYTTGNHTGVFYAESWALLHYLRLGRTDLPRDKVDVFLHYIRNEPPGADPVFRRKLFQEATGMDYPQMEDALDRYVRSGEYTWSKIPLPAIPAKAGYPAWAMPLAEIRERLAELDVRVNRSPRGRLELLNAIDRTPADPRPLEVLGNDAWLQGDEQMMRERWQAALDAGSQDPAIYCELGKLEGSSIFSSFDLYFRLPEEREQRLRLLLKRSIAYAPDQTDAYELLAWVEATAAKPDISGVNLVQSRYKTLTHKSRTLLALALVRDRLNDRATALAILGQIDKMAPEYFVAVTAEALRAKLENRRPRPVNRPPEAPVRVWIPDVQLPR